MQWSSTASTSTSLCCRPFSVQHFSLYSSGKKKIWQKYLQWEREEKRKLWRNIFSFCLHLFSFRIFFFFFSPFIRFVPFQLREMFSMMSNKQTQKKKKKFQSYQLALHSLREVLGMEWRVIVHTAGWTQRRRRRRGRSRKKVNKVHGGESSNSSRRQKMAAQLTARKHSPHCHAGGCRRAWFGC